MKRYLIGLQDFEKLRGGGYLYVDKTQQMFRLLQSGSHFFLSLPRRFGKSLLLNALKDSFQFDLSEGEAGKAGPATRAADPPAKSDWRTP